MEKTRRSRRTLAVQAQGAASVLPSPWQPDAPAPAADHAEGKKLPAATYASASWRRQGQWLSVAKVQVGANSI